MNRFNLRRKPRISYFEPDEPNFDEYLYCDKCTDYVYEYCSIHGPLLVIPDEKVPAKTNFPSYVPRAALTIPNAFLHIAPSIIPGAGLGIFSSLTLPRGVRFGPYTGERSYNHNSMYCWQIYDKNNRPCYVVDAADENKSNWMRYVNCARHWNEQNLTAYQYQGQLYYRTIKTIPKFTELMVFYGSEFANTLRVDLRRYNSPPTTEKLTDAPPPKKVKVIEDGEKNAASNTKEQSRKPILSKIEFQTPECKDSVEKIQLKPRHKTKADKAKSTLIHENKVENDVIPTKSTFTCNHCHQQFATKILLSDHITIHVVQNISNTTYQCKLCKHEADSRESLDQHLIHHGVKKQSFICNICSYKFKNQIMLDNHVTCCDKTKVIKQSDIDRTSLHTTKNIVKDKPLTHTRTNTGEKPFACTMCDYKSSKRANLLLHTRTHTGEKPFACTMCDYKSSKRANLLLHTRTHTGEKPFACIMCKYKCSNKAHLLRHTRTHTGEKPFACTLCEFKCSQRGNLLTHTRTHTGEKPFSCTLCEFKCSDRASLSRHTRTHTGDKPFACTMCEYKCSARNSLAYHMRKHTNVKP